MNPIGFIKKIFTFAKKQAVQPAKAADAPFEKDDNVVLVFGHSNAGKTVYFSVLYELLKSNEEFKLSTLNNETAATLIESYNLMRGKLLKIRDGRQVEVEGERKFPTMTSETRILKFALDKSLRKGIKFYTVDYKGETLALAEPGELRKQFAKFFPFARAALFFLDASVLDTDVLLREQIAAFQTILHDLRDCAPKRVPVGIVITKADFMEGFSTSNPVELIPSNAAIYKGRRKESFLHGLAKVNARRFGEVWARSTERMARTLGIFIDSVSAYNLDFQIFFVSSTGGLMKSASGGVEPPRDIKPYGIAEPLMWAFNRITFNKRKYFWGSLVKVVFVLCLVWAALFTLVNLGHWALYYSNVEKADEYKRDHLKPGSEESGDQRVITMAKGKYKGDYIDKHPIIVSEFFGAKPMIDYAKYRIYQIDSIAAAAPHVIGDRGPRKPSYEGKTSEAQARFGELTRDVSKEPPDQLQAAAQKAVDQLFSEFPPDSLDPKFVADVKKYPDNVAKAGSGALEQEFKFSIVAYGLRDNTQLVLQVDGADFEFTQSSDNPTPEKQVTCKGNSVLKFLHRDFATKEQKEEAVDKPLENFYPKLKSGGYKLDFDAGLGIFVKWKPGSGEPPAIPQVSTP